MNVDQKLDKLEDVLGVSKLLSENVNALETSDLDDYLNFIARCWGVDLGNSAHKMEVDKKFCKIANAIGYNTLLNEVLSAMETDKLEENLDFIARCWDIDLSDGEDD